jgi:hypothetical protein
VKTPVFSEEMITSILSNWRGENWSIDSRIPFSYKSLALYLNEPNCGLFPDLCRSRRWKYCFVNGITKRFFLSGACQYTVSEMAERIRLPLSALHGGHRSLNIIMVAVNLLFEVLLAFTEMFQSIHHAVHLLLTLQSFTVLAANVTGDGIEDALKSIISRDLSLLLKLKEEEDCMCFDFLELKPGYD